jgi:hypothetical protein
LERGFHAPVDRPARRLTGQDTYCRLADFKKPGVSGWVACYNTKTKKFELTDRFRKNNKGARKRWNRAADEKAPEDGFVPPSAESIGHEGPDTPVAERLKKYEAQLAALVKKRESQLDGVDRAEFQKKEKDWREQLEKESAEIKDMQQGLVSAQDRHGTTSTTRERIGCLFTRN